MTAVGVLVVGTWLAGWARWWQTRRRAEAAERRSRALLDERTRAVDDALEQRARVYELRRAGKALLDARAAGGHAQGSDWETAWKALEEAVK